MPAGIIDRAEIREGLRAFVHVVTGAFALSQVVLFGSSARGEYYDHCDIDPFIVGDFPGRFFDRIRQVLECARAGLEIAPWVYKSAGFETTRRAGNPFLATALSEGISLLA